VVQSDEDADQVGTEVVDAVPGLGPFAGHTSSLELASVYLQALLYNFGPVYLARWSSRRETTDTTRLPGPRS
jgi:hypothetical protein